MARGLDDGFWANWAKYTPHSKSTAVPTLLSLVLLLFYTLLTGGRLSAQTITVETPSIRENRAPETTLAPTRDFMVTGTITGANAQNVTNLSFSLYKSGPDGQKTGDPVRTVDTFTYTQDKTNNLYVEYDQIINTRMATKQAEMDALTAHPMPDLVYDSTLTDPEAREKSIKNPTNKAVLVDDDGLHFAAIFLGGATKNFFSDYGVYDDQGTLHPYDDLSQGKYLLEVTAYNASGEKITDATVLDFMGNNISDSGLELNYEPSNMIFSRYSSAEHIAKFQKLASAPTLEKDKYKTMFDFFPGYWNNYDRGGAFGELLGRWEENDWMEYEYAPKTLGMIYDIDSGCATLKEIYRIIKCGHLESGAVETQAGKYKLKNQVYLYHYDWGDESLTYTRRDGTTATISGDLILFKDSIDPNSIDMNKEYATEEEASKYANNKYMHLDLTRVDLYGSDVDPASMADNADRLTDASKQVSLVHAYQSPNATAESPRSLILARSEQSIGLFGAVTPLNATISDVSQRDITLYSGSTTVTADVVEYELKPENDTWIKSVQYTLYDPDGDQKTTGNVATGLVRTMPKWVNNPSLFEFKALIGEENFDQEGLYTLSLFGQDRNGNSVERTAQSVDIFITRTGIFSAAGMNLTTNQLAVGDAMLDMLIENNAPSANFASAYTNAPATDAAAMLSQLSGDRTVASISKLAFNPLITSINRLDTWHGDTNVCSRPTGNRDLWATYLHHGQDIDATDDINAFDVSGNGLAVGYDRGMTFGRMGAAFVYEESVDQGDLQKNELDDITAVAYGKVNITGQLWFNGLFGYSWRDYRTDRVNQWNNFSERLAGDFSGHGVWANFRLERDLRLARGILTPFVGYEANWNRFDQYREEGGVSALAFDARSEDYGFLQAGARTTWCGHYFDLGIRAMYVHRVSGPDRAEYTAALTGSDGFNYLFNGRGILNSTDYYDLNLDLRYRVSDQTNLFTGYNGLYGNRSSGHLLTAGLNTQW
ncbi:MAG: autotransporter outer membrane beta-barrel domain-containing protein [Planctomycetia bacterium]|nr:autotransporter outer membrane beta-barrel domain-containing protein [Planctomycetia bacterium]